MMRLINYFKNIRKQDCPGKNELKRWEILLKNTEIMIETKRKSIPTTGGLLRLPNTITIERMKTGCRYTRNELIKEVMRDYHYIESTGMGVPRKIIAGMKAHNGTEPDFIEDDYSLL